MTVIFRRRSDDGAPTPIFSCEAGRTPAALQSVVPAAFAAGVKQPDWSGRIREACYGAGSVAGVVWLSCGFTKMAGSFDL
jgi:hypothetical protein